MSETLSDPADCRPICTKCGEAVKIRSIREDGWIQLEPHRCRVTPCCPTCQSPDPHRHPTNDFGESGPVCQDSWHTPKRACQHCETWKTTLAATERDRKRLELRVDELEEELRLRRQAFIRANDEIPEHMSEAFGALQRKVFEQHEEIERLQRELTESNKLQRKLVQSVETRDLELDDTHRCSTQDEDLLLRAGKAIREFAEFAGDDHSVGVCNCPDMRIVEEIELRLGRLGITKKEDHK